LLTPKLEEAKAGAGKCGPRHMPLTHARGVANPLTDLRDKIDFPRPPVSIGLNNQRRPAPRHQILMGRAPPRSFIAGRSNPVSPSIASPGDCLGWQARVTSPPHTRRGSSLVSLPSLVATAAAPRLRVSRGPSLSPSREEAEAADHRQPWKGDFLG
jgi:hypothetical protein